MKNSNFPANLDSQKFFYYIQNEPLLEGFLSN